MKTYQGFVPSGFDSHIHIYAHEEGEEDVNDWLVAPVTRNRDSDVLEESNWAVVLSDLGGEGDNVQIHRFGHWACGWFEIVLVRAGSPEAKSAEEWEAALEHYPIADENDLSEREHEAAYEIWTTCYSVKERIDYIRRASKHEFEFRSFADLLGCVRGKYFAGYDSELIGR